MFWWSGQQEWSFFQFLLLISYATLLYSCGFAALARDLPENFAFDAHFFETRPWFFSVIVIAWIIDIPETVLKSDDGLHDPPRACLVLIVTQLALTLLAAVWSNRGYQRFFAFFGPSLQ